MSRSPYCLALFGCLLVAPVVGAQASDADASGDAPLPAGPVRLVLDVGRLQGTPAGAAFRGARWRPDGNAVAWGFVDDVEPANKALAPLRRELDLTRLEVETKTDADFKDYPGAADLGRLTAAGGRTARLKDAKTLEISDGNKSVEVAKGTATIHPYGWTFVDADHLVVTTTGSATLDVIEPATGKVLHRRRLAQSSIGSVAPAPASATHPLVLVGSNDRTLTIYNAITDQILLTVCAAGGDWIAWTPEGYFAATPGGERWVGWQFDAGADKVASFSPVLRFRKRLYRPDVIQRVLEKGSVAEALKAADAARGQGDSPRIEIAKLLPPQVTKLAIIDTRRMPEIRVEAVATAGAKEQPIRALRLLLDGRPPDGGGLIEFTDNPEEKATVEWKLKLPPGTHRLSVLARSADASSISAPVECTNAKTKVNLPALHVLAVGVNQYKNGIPPLKSAVADARSIAGAFRATNPAPFAKAVVRVLLDSKARRDDVLGAVAKLRADVKPNDLAIVHFAGYGVKDQTGFYLLPADADPKKLQSTAISGAELRRELGEFSCQVLLVLDASHAGGPIKNFRPVADDMIRTLSDDECGVAVLSATLGNEQAQTKDGKGLFSAAAVDVLTRKADIPLNREDKKVYIHDLHRYVFDEVARLSNQGQHPALSLPSVVESFPIRTLKMK